MAHVIERDTWARHPENWHGELQGAAYGAGVSVIGVALSQSAFHKEAVPIAGRSPRQL